jgi:hypothetical protein
VKCPGDNYCAHAVWLDPRLKAIPRRPSR